MALWCIWLISVLLPAVFGAPTVHLQDAYHESATVANIPNSNAVQLGARFAEAQPAATGKPHIVEPTWITVTGPPPVYTPPGNPGQLPHVMQPYYTYVPVPPENQPWPWPAQWPSYYPGMPVLPHPAGPSQLCQQPSNPYRVT
uniref:Uncharacterized protein n=1 Tax=Anopheles atroparvus TaxID=41427 RepID=A0A182IWB6_ANOAO